MSRKDFTVTSSNFPGSAANPNSIDKIRELSEVAMATESPSVDSDNDISKLIKNLLFMGRLSKDVKIGEATFTVNTLTEDRQRVLVSRVMRMTNEEKIAYAKVYSVAESVTAINGISIDEISKTMYPDEESLEVARINFFGRLQSTVIDILFEEYEVLIKKSREEIGYEEVKVASESISRLRWKMCKIWKVRINDPIFNSMSPHELLWYAENIRLDELEDYKEKRDIAEYNAMFFNPDGVKEVRKGRDSDNSKENENFNPEEAVASLKEDPIVQAIKERYKKEKEDSAPNSFSKIKGAIDIT